MWKPMLKTELLEIRMDELNKLFELKINDKKIKEPPSVRLKQADLIELMHTLLEINRVFRGDVSFYASVREKERLTHSFIEDQKMPEVTEKSTSAHT